MESTETSSRVDEWRPLTREQLAESLIFERRRLAGKFALEMLKAGWAVEKDPDAVAAIAESYAHAICAQLAARETGRPEGYK
jgi:hypothetical protein